MSVFISGCGGRVRVSCGHLCAQHRSTDRGGSRDLEPTVLYFLCGENTAVGSVALTVHRTVIHYHLTLRVIRPRAHNPTSKIKIFFIIRNEKRHPYGCLFSFLVAEEGCGCPVDTSVHSTEAPTEAAAETLNQRSCIFSAEKILRSARWL